MKGECKHEVIGNFGQHRCKLHDQYLARETCEQCEDYEESEE